MTSTKTLLLAAALAVPGVIAATGAQAQVAGVAVVDQEGAIRATRAFQAAANQIRTTYKTQIDQAEARRQAVTRELQPLVTSYQNAARQPNATPASLQAQAQAIQTRENAANQELARLLQPVQRAQGYAVEQVALRYAEAAQNVIRQRNVQLLLRPEALVFSQPAADITAAITTELDRLVPTVSTNVPANWQPGQAQPSVATGARPATATPAPATTPARRPQGR